MDDLFIVIGKLYTDLSNSQKYIEMLQQQLRDKNQEILELKKPKVKDE
jgi:hypothetical protein